MSEIAVLLRMRRIMLRRFRRGRDFMSHVLKRLHIVRDSSMETS